jgi:hypothetical protein
MLFATTKNVISLWPSFAVYLSAAGVLFLGVLVGVLVEATAQSPSA